jgi:5'-methylthioadenosine phosphorylase
LGICYQSVAMATDYDCWRENEETVSIETVLKVMKQNSENVKKLFLNTIPKIKNKKNCFCEKDAENAKI